MILRSHATWNGGLTPTSASLVEFLKPCATRWESGEEFCWVITVKPESRADGAIACRVRGHAVDFALMALRWRNSIAGT